MSDYTCSYGECQLKRGLTSQSKRESDPFVPHRLLVCGHSVCELCVLRLCQTKKEFIKCTLCSFNTTINESVHKNVRQYESDIRKWLDSTSSGAQVLRMEMSLFPLDLYQIGNGVDLGLITATKTAQTIDLDDESAPTAQPLAITYTPANNLIEDDTTVRNIIPRIPRTAPKRFFDSVENAVKIFTEMSANHTALKRMCEETKEHFKKSKANTREAFHKLHSILQIREKEMLEEIDVVAEERQQDLKVFMNEILSKRSELKGKLLQCSQMQTDSDRNKLKKSIEQLLKDENTMPLTEPKDEFKFIFDPTLENRLKTYGTIERINHSVNESQPTDNESQELSTSMDTPISLSSDEDEENTIEEVPKSDTMNNEVVNVLLVVSPYKFYVQKSSDREKFEFLNQQIQSVCTSAYYHSPAIETLPIGERVFAYSLIKKCWCRATLTHFRQELSAQTRELTYVADIVLIDYGMTETVQWFNVREKKLELFNEKKWPPFAYKCSLYSVKPHRKSSQRESEWSREAIDLFNRYVTNNQLILFDFETREGVKLVDLIHYEVPDVVYHIPTLIEALVKNELAVMTADIDFAGYNRYKCQPISYTIGESPKSLKTLSVLVSHIETPDLFYVQLQRRHQSLLKLIDDLNHTYTDENAGIYTYYCPKVNTACAALFEGDNKFYRALVIKAQNTSETVVQFVDFGNKQIVKNSNLRLLKKSFLDLPVQSIACGLIHVEPSYGFKWAEDATKYFKYAISNDRGPQILTMCIYEVTQKKLMVVLRSYDGDSGIKVNEMLVKRKFAISSGQHSQPDISDRSTSDESLNSIASTSSLRNGVPLEKTIMPFKISATLVLNDLKERYERSSADKRSSLIKVMVTFAANPSEFFVQIDRPEVRDYFEAMERELHKEYNSSKHQFLGDTNFMANDLCAFRVADNWRRGSITERLSSVSPNGTPEEPRFSVLDIDFGGVHELRVSQMRRLSDDFLKDGEFSLKCKLHLLRPTGGDQWTHSAKDEFNEFIQKFGKELYILVKGKADSEPICVVLYGKETTIPSAFSKQKTVYNSINTILVNKGLATYDRSDSSSVNGIDSETDDDNDINTETVRENRPQMPFSYFSSTESVLESLQNRYNKDTDCQIVKDFRYLNELYPTENTFYGIPTDIEVCKEYIISFRVFIESVGTQPLQVIEKCIEDTLNAKGELEPFDGPYTKGIACTAYFEFDKTWNRAEIVGVTQKPEDQHSKLVVRFVDYGNQESILVDKLSSEVFGRDTPKLALKCQIINIKPFNEEADKSIRDIIYRQIVDHKTKFCWENYPKLPMKVSLEISYGDTYEPLLSVLDRLNLMASNTIEENDSVEEIMSLSNLIDRTYGLYPIQFDLSRFYEVVVSFPLTANYAFFQATEVKHAFDSDVVIGGQYDSFLLMLNKMRSEVETYPLVQNLREGYPCAAQYSDDCWYRGLIISVDRTERIAQIFFVDYGNSDTVPFNRLREIPKVHMRPRAHSMFCEVYNIKPAKNQLWARSAELSEQISNYLTEICAERKLFARFKNRKYPLKIDLYFGDQNDQKVPERHVFQDFVDEGLLEFVEPRDVWRKPMQTTDSYRSTFKVKDEKIDY